MGRGSWFLIIPMALTFAPNNRPERALRFRSASGPTADRSKNTGWSRSYFDAASQITHLLWLYRPGARPIGVYVLAAPACGVHKRSIAALPMYPLVEAY